MFKWMSTECLGECDQTGACVELIDASNDVSHGDVAVETPEGASAVKVHALTPRRRTGQGKTVELECSGRRYEFKTGDVLGEGSFGCVYFGTAHTGSKSCAIKHVPKANPLLVATSLDEYANRRSKHVAQLRLEAVILKTLSHNNIIRLIDSSEDLRNFYLVLEYCSGGKLARFINNEKLCPNFIESDASHILQHVVDAIQYLHGKFFCHRDIKPDNIILASTRPIIHNIAKLIDFGFACECRPGTILRDSVGTPMYMSPQVVEGNYDISADIWSCGVTTYQLLSGRVPFKAHTEDGLMKLVRRGNYSFNGEEWYHITENAKAFVRGMMTYVPKDRVSAEGAASHKWITKHAPGASKMNLARL